jgi:demethylmenaquinone methyltransferase/2-methoxy-6-polyprenyl-1,4-benzoquinol methylase
MANPFYEPGAQRAAKVNDLFSGIAARYDLINDLQSLGLHRFWKRRLVRLARVGPGDRALDVCCGTGDVALALARTGATVTGLDFSEPMLAVARRRAAAAPDGTRLEFRQGDALQLPFPDRSFEAVTISYGLRNLAEVAGGLREMWRVAKPGGRLLVLDFGKPDNAFWRRCYFAYLRRGVPIFGRWFAGSAVAYAYIVESLEHYPGQRGVAELLQALPTREVRIHNLLGGVMGINSAERADA